MNKATSVPSIYRSLLKEANKLNDYNLKDYAKRRIMFGFKGHSYGINKSLVKESDILFNKGKNDIKSQTIDERIKEAKDSLEMIKRQVIIQNLYYHSPSVMVNLKSKSI